MGYTIWIQVDPPGAGGAPAEDHSILAKLEHELGALAERLGVPKLASFYDYSVLQQEYGEDAGLTGKAKETWSDPQAILVTVDALRASLADDAAGLRFTPRPSQTEWLEQLAKELEHYHSILSEAARRRRKARLLIVP
jgi:hypothetical protein